MRKIVKMSLIALSLFVMLSLTFSSSYAASISTINEESTDDIITVDIGYMKMEYINNPDENYVKITFDTPSNIDFPIFEIGQTIRMQASWEIVEGGLRQDYWNFSIDRVSLESWYLFITPENEIGWYSETHDSPGEDDSSTGILYFDFTPTRDWFRYAWHKSTASVTLRCEYKNKRWLDTEWTTTIQTKKLEGDLEYENTPPTITNYDVVKDEKEVTLNMNVEDPDFRPSSRKGDYIRILEINWGDGNTDTNIRVGHIEDGELSISQSHEYQRKGTYTIKAKVIDWFNGGYGDESNEISTAVEVSQTSSKHNLDFIFDFFYRFPFFEKINYFFGKLM